MRMRDFKKIFEAILLGKNEIESFNVSGGKGEGNAEEAAATIRAIRTYIKADRKVIEKIKEETGGYD